jgi:hypothetical protein
MFSDFLSPFCATITESHRLIYKEQKFRAGGSSVIGCFSSMCEVLDSILGATPTPSKKETKQNRISEINFSYFWRSDRLKSRH